MSSDDDHLLWLAEQAFREIVSEHGVDVKRTIDELRKLSTEMVFSSFQDFVRGVDLFVCLTRDERWYSDAINRRNLCVFIDDYMRMKPTKLHALDDFFGQNRMARVFQFFAYGEDGASHTVACAIALDPEVVAGMSQRRLVLYALAIGNASSVHQWRRLARARTGPLLEQGRLSTDCWLDLLRVAHGRASAACQPPVGR